MAEGQKKRLAEMNSVHTIQMNIKEYNTALTVQDMPFILENLDTGSIFQTKPFEIPLGKEPNAPIAIGMIGFYTHGVKRNGHLKPSSTFAPRHMSSNSILKLPFWMNRLGFLKIQPFVFL